MRSEPSYTHSAETIVSICISIVCSFTLAPNAFKKVDQTNILFSFLHGQFFLYSWLWVDGGMAGTTTGYMKRYEFNLYANFTCQI